MAKEIDYAAIAAEQQATIEALKTQMQAVLAQQPATNALQLLAERSAPRENPDYNERSVYTHPEGERVRPKAHLSRETFFCGSRVRTDELTPAEVDAFNSFTESRTARGGTWKADVRQNGSHQELHIDVPSRTVDDRMNLPGSLLLILAELKGGARAVDPMALAQRIAELEAKLQIA